MSRRKKDRKFYRLVITVLCCTFLSTGFASLAQEDEKVPDEVGVVMYVTESVPEASFAEDEFLVVYESGDGLAGESELVEVPDGSTINEAMSEYETNPDVMLIQPNYYYEPCSVSVDDVRADEQWYLNVIRAEEAWKTVREKAVSKVRVAVIDSGVDFDHEDLDGQLMYGASRNEVNDTALTEDKSRDSHGTAVNGIIGATTGNGIGIAGIAGGYAELLNICVYDTSSGTAKISTNDLVAAVRYAVDMHVDVINMSLGSYQYDAYLEAVLAEVENLGIPVVCAGGNGGTDKVHYPSDFSGTIGVIALDEQLNRPSYANYGAKKTISAPGSSILSTVSGNGYATKSGSSLAAPVVTAIAALMKAVDPSLNSDQIRKILQETATDLGAEGFDADTASGLVNAEAAVNKAAEHYAAILQAQCRSAWIRGLYHFAADRDATSEELSYWLSRVQNGDLTGESLTGTFLSEYGHDNTKSDNETYLRELYMTLLGRVPDEGGMDYWKGILEQGGTREVVRACFVNSDEFVQRCSKAGLLAWRYPDSYMVKMTPEEKISLLYRLVLMREPDTGGYCFWVEVLTDKRLEPEGIYECFIGSDEYRYLKGLRK